MIFAVWITLKIGKIATLVALMLVVDGRVRKLQSQNIISIESISLQSINDDRCLQSWLEISKTKNDFLARLLLTRNETDSFEALEWPENVSDFPLRGI